MPCASTACARLRNAARFLRRSTIKGLLTGAEIVAAAPVEAMDEDELLAELEGAAGASDITELRHVRTSADKRAAEEIANREKCEDFDRFKPLFAEGSEGARHRHPETRPFVKDAGFLKAEIARATSSFSAVRSPMSPMWARRSSAPNGEFDARLRVDLLDNGTESNLLRRDRFSARCTRTRPGDVLPIRRRSAVCR